jgi:uncharacterized membrane protein YfcA
VGVGAAAAAAFVVLVAAVVQGASGIGFALVAVPLLSLVAVDARTAVLLANALGLITSSALAIRGRDQVDRPVVRRVLVGAAAGIPLGLVLILTVTDRVLQAVIGVAVIASVVLLASGRRLHRDTPALELGAGVASGALNTALGTGGPPVTLLLQARGLAPGPFRATVSVVFAAIDVVAVVLLTVGLSADGTLDGRAAVAFAASLPALGAGWWVGDRLHGVMSPSHFRSVVLVLSAATGAIALAAAVAG